MKKKMRMILMSERNKIPQINLTKFDMISQSYLEEIEKRPFEYEKLSLQLSQEINKFKTVNLETIPPMLCQRLNEEKKDWLDRCYKAGNYS